MLHYSQIPSVPAQSLVRELSSEGGLTPLHLAAYSGSENVVRGLLNSPAVQVGLWEGWLPTKLMGI